MKENIKKNNQLVKAKTSSLQKRASNIVSRGLSDLALLDVEGAKRIKLSEIVSGTGVFCAIDSFGEEGPEVFTEGTTIYINKDHPIYKRESANLDTHRLNVTRLITQEISLLGIFKDKTLQKAREFFEKELQLEIGLDEAIEACTDSLSANPNADDYYFRGCLYLGKEQYDNAIEDFNKVIALDPNDAKAYYNRGSAYSSKGQHDMAIEDCNRAIVINPNDAGAYNNRGIAYEMKGNIDKAIEDFKKACDLGNEKGCENLQKILRQR